MNLKVILKIIICMLILIQNLETEFFFPQNISSLSIHGHGIQLWILFGYLCFSNLILIYVFIILSH